LITEATLKVRSLPPVRAYGSVVFPDFDSGVCALCLSVCVSDGVQVAALMEVQRQRTAPASIRLVDNEQFKFGQARTPPSYLCCVWCMWLE
jgi:alkyldihydroxyacetonephosphate synthase